uniref:Uncharacterized protein n=1 Tax=viral metagenome TaxID=1070528 RepID=A0A6M3K5T3_9ZZZZ
MKSGERQPIVLECQSCDRITVGPEPGPPTCKIYYDPNWIWSRGYCVFKMRNGLLKESISVTEKEMQDYQNEPPFKGNGDDDG